MANEEPRIIHKFKWRNFLVPTKFWESGKDVDEYNIAVNKNAAINAHNWLEKAEKHIRSADALNAAKEKLASDGTAHPGDFSSFFSYQESSQLLLAFAVENILKGLLIIQEFNKDAEALPLRKNKKNGQEEFHLFGQTNHDLFALAHRCRIEPDEHAEAILKYFTDLIQWRGRYPAPKSSFNQTPNLVVGSSYHDSRRMVMEWYKMLRDEIPSELFKSGICDSLC